MAIAGGKAIAGGREDPLESAGRDFGRFGEGLGFQFGRCISYGVCFAARTTC